MAQKEEKKLDLGRSASDGAPDGENLPENPFETPEYKAAASPNRKKSLVDQLKSAVGAGSSSPKDGVHFADAEAQPSPYRKMSLMQMGKAIITGEIPEDELESAEWRPGEDLEEKPRRLKTENAKWSDPKFDPIGKGEHETRDFKRPEDWWFSAEQAVELLEAERRGLKKDFSQKSKPAAMLNSVMAANRIVTQGLKTMMDRADEQQKVLFRDGLEPIVHVLPPDIQRQMHALLCKSVKAGAREEVDNLLRFQIDLDYSDVFGTPLHYAVECNQLGMVKALLDKGAYPGALNCRDQTPLHLAVMVDAPLIVELLLRFGAPANALEIGGMSAVHMAAQHGYVKVLERLILGGADCNKPNRMGWTALHLAAVGQHHEAMDKLCINGMANPNIACTRTVKVEIPVGSERSVMFQCVKGDTPAHFAARCGYFYCLKVCLDNAGKTDAVNEGGETVMHAAIAKADERIIDLILEHGWDFLDMKDEKGRDPIDIVDTCVVAHHSDSPEDVAIRSTLTNIKTTLAKMGIRKNQQKHKELIEQARKGIGGRRKQTTNKNQDGEGTQNEAADPDIEDVEIDEKTVWEKMAAMTMELEAARAEARAAEQQSRLKTHSLNEVLQDTKRRLAESEFMLERERASRFSLEQELLDMIAVGSAGDTRADYDDEDLSTGRRGGDSSRGYEADVLRVGTSGASRGYSSTGVRRSVTFDGAATQ